MFNKQLFLSLAVYFLRHLKIVLIFCFSESYPPASDFRENVLNLRNENQNDEIRV